MVVGADDDAWKLRIGYFGLGAEDEKVIRPQDGVCGGVAQGTDEGLLVAHMVARWQHDNPSGRIALRDAHQAHENSVSRTSVLRQNDETRSRHEPKRAFQPLTTLLPHDRPDVGPVSKCCRTVQYAAQQRSKRARRIHVAIVIAWREN